ncbi:hypothetical protein BJ508DRAFT_52995 [Ascobolus immersus RN42]|uniref:Uncharacterized protein n=1 Tax=Ascobolus immersus RN42 TaxID=1160509 RepID=A0A3N4HKA1_ASCIM|nr:hypothetical protein BJ508DRAFT_52995 [Ascobolus immersus RN42]
MPHFSSTASRGLLNDFSTLRHICYVRPAASELVPSAPTLSAITGSAFGCNPPVHRCIIASKDRLAFQSVQYIHSTCSTFISFASDHGDVFPQPSINNEHHTQHVTFPLDLPSTMNITPNMYLSTSLLMTAAYPYITASTSQCYPIFRTFNISVGLSLII